MSNITVTRTYTRPNSSVEFYTVYGPDPIKVAFRTHWGATYKHSGKIVDTVESFNGNIYQIIAVYRDKAAYDETLKDPVVEDMRARISDYNVTNGIVEQSIIS